MLTPSFARTTQLPESSLTEHFPEELSLILIEPVSASRQDHQYFLCNGGYRVKSVRDNRELSLLRASESFAFALISDTLGSVRLDDAARSVRQEWPAARILVLGHAAVVIEDYLYDEALPHSCGPQDLCDTLTRMSKPRTQGRPFIVTIPASEHESAQRRKPPHADHSLRPDAPERMTQTQTKV